MGKLNKAMFSSASDSWPTPQAFFDGLNARFGFTLDVCADDQNAKADRYFTKEDDGLSHAWTGTVWMNPPYGREIGKWVRKAYESSRAGATVVCLVPARTETRWWHDYIMLASEIWLVKGRLTFGNATAPCTFPNAVAVFHPYACRKSFGAMRIDGSVIPYDFEPHMREAA